MRAEIESNEIKTIIDRGKPPVPETGPKPIGPTKEISWDIRRHMPRPDSAKIDKKNRK